MCEKSFSRYFFIFTFLEFLTLTRLTFHDGSHGFITKKSRYFEDQLTHIHEEIGSLQYIQRVDSLANLNLRFEPDVLDFRERSLGSPHSEIVTLFNTDSNKTVELTSISGNTVHFHSSFFEDKQIAPNGNTSFKIIYLGRQEGPVESTLFLHTSSGFIKYNVKAFGTFNSYRVRPIVGVKVPVNSTFTPVIYMHNPHSEPIQIVEIYSSGGGFHLELPSGQHEGPNDLWEINPQETKAIIRVRFEAKIPHNYTAYIRIKLHNPEEILIVPLEVEVIQVQSIFHPQGYIDLGVGGSLDAPKEVNICLFNPLKRAVRIHSVSTLSKSIKTQYYNIRINPGNDEENKCVNVGTLTVDWKNAWKTQDYHGKIIIKFRNGKNRTEIPYFLSVLKGGLTYDKMSTTYFLNDKEMDTTERKFEVLNEFRHPIRVLDVKFPFDVDTTFKIQTFTPVTIRPYDRKNLFNIWLKSTVKKTDMQLASHIKLITNVSEVVVPLLSYNGKLQIHLPFASDDYSLNVGLMGCNTRKQIFFMLTNPNPVDLPLIHVYSSLPMAELELFGCGTGDHKMVLLLNSFDNLSKCDRIGAQGYAIIKMEISTNDKEGQVWGDIQIQTPYENLSLPVHYRVSSGEVTLDENELTFKNCFPGKMCSHILKVFSSFSEKMSVENILALPPDKRVSAAITGTIVPKTNKVIGHLYFNPDLECSPECYTGFLNEGSASWLRTLVITKQVSEYDMKLANMFYGRFINFTNYGSKVWTNITLRLDTSEVKGHIFKSRIKYSWPSLVHESILTNNSTLEFPLTQVSNISYKTLALHNPASHNVVVQLVFENDYPHAELLYDGLSQKFIPPSEIKFITNKWFSFEEKTVEHQRKYFWDNLRISVFKHSLPFILPPGQTKRVTLGFLAEDAKIYSSLLFLRNNLTILEVLRLNGKGTIPLFKFGNRKPGALQPLLFEVSEKHLKVCKEEESYQTPILPNLTVKRSFTARNLGDIPIQVNSFHINGYPCEGFGFKVMDCDPFTLLPNISKKIDIAFTPDLTLARVQRTLVISTSLNSYVNYTLYATIPMSYCADCERLIERPPWEIYMSYITIVFMKVMLFLIIFIAVLDAETIKRQAWEVYIASNSPPVLPVLDLRKIGRQVREEIQSSLKEKMLEEDRNELDEHEISKSEPAIIPTTGKAKKRLAQRSSLNDDDNIEDESERERIRERQRKKDLLFERHRLKSRERKTEKVLKLLEEKGRKEKHAQQKETDFKKAPNKKQCKFTAVPGQEEEASSTTTESSNSSANYDEVDKENQRLNAWSNQKVNVSSQTVNVVNLREAQDSKIKHVSFVNSKLRNKVKPQDQSKDQQIFKIDDKFGFNFNGHNRERRKRDLKFKERKEKLIYRNKTHNERKPKNSEGDSVSEKESTKRPVSFYIPFPTSTTACSGWCETRARFSDVVARNELLNDQSPVSTASSDSPLFYTNDNCSFAQDNTNTPNGAISNSPFKQNKLGSGKPTMYVEPYKPIDLGPIGSKRMGTPGKGSPDLYGYETHSLLTENPFQKNASNPFAHSPSEFNPMHDKSVIAAINKNTLLSSSPAFFTQPQNMHFGRNEENSKFNDIAYVDRWNRQQVFKDITDKRDHQTLMEPNKQNNFSVETEGDSWKKSSVPGNNDYWSNTFSSVLNSTSKLANNASYLWGSSPIWKPWSPADSPNPVRRTPPGFDDHINKKRVEDEQKRRQQRESFNPYDPASPWPQHTDPSD